MDLYDSVLASKPLTAFKLNAGGTAYTDITNRAVAFTPASSLLFANTIAATGRAKSLFVKNANAASFVSGPVYAKGFETASWTLEAWAMPISPTSGNVSIMSHTGAYDGLFIDLDYVHFKIDFATTADIDLKWPMPDAYEVWHIVGVYTPSKVQLYINGEKVAEQDVTDAQVKDGFATNNGSLYVGQSTGAIQAMVDAPVTYARALADAEIYKHFVAGRRVIPTFDNSGRLGAITYDYTKREVFATKEWDSDNWTDAIYTNIQEQTGSLSPAENPATQVSLAGVWTGSFEVGASTTNLYGVQVDWDADGSYTIQASIDDGVNWITLVNGRGITGTWNWNPAGKVVLIRVTFTGGVTSDISKFRRIRAVAFSNPTVYTDDASRSITLSGIGIATNRDFNEPIENNFMAGLEFWDNATSATINPDSDPDDPRPIRSLEFWVKFNGTTASKYIFDARPSGGTEFLWANASSLLAFGTGTLYVNGVAAATGTFTVDPEKWYHILYVLPANVSTTINLPAAGPRQVGMIKSYPFALTATDATNLYTGYRGYVNAALATEANPVSEAATPFKLYAYDWSISPTG